MMYINKANTSAINLLSCRDTWSSSLLRGGSEHCTPKSQASFDILGDILRKNQGSSQGLEGYFGVNVLSAFGFGNLSCLKLDEVTFGGD